jgi:hypothetical protein
MIGGQTHIVSVSGLNSMVSGVIDTVGSMVLDAFEGKFNQKKYT